MSAATPRARLAGGPAAGFTLLEVLAVLALTAVLTTIAAVSLRQSVRRAGERDAAERLAAFDNLARIDCRRSQRSCQLVFSVGGQSVRRVRSESETEVDSPALQLGGNQSIARVMLPNRSIEAGDAAVEMSASGLSASYVVELRRAGDSQFILLTGLGGKQVKLKDADEAQSILAAVATRHDDR